MVRTNTFFAFVAGLLLFPAMLPAKAAQQPLLLSGKKMLFERVLAVPGAGLYREPRKSATAKPTVPFSVYYLYERKRVSGEDWVKVGSDSHGTVLGWIASRDTIPWNQTLTVAFKNAQGTDRVLLFKNRDPLKQLAEAHDLNAYARVYESAIKGQLPADSPVVAIQPPGQINIQDNFYLVPIKQHEDVFLGSAKARLLQVASVPLAGGQGAGPDNPNPGYRSGIVFAIDTTQSMRPYIDRTREVVRKVYDTIKSAGLQNRVSFGLTAFQDHPKAVPVRGYLTRTFATLAEGTEPERFFRQVKAVVPAGVSNKDFHEDSFAGVKNALEANDWRGFDARTIILVTDASSRTADDPLSSTGLDAKALRQLALNKGVAIWVLHLRTDMGREDHARAEAQYKELSYYPGIGDIYYGVKMGDVEEFGRVLETLAHQVTEQVKATAQGAPPLIVPKEEAGTDLAALQQKVAKLGYALQMQYLQKTKGAKPPAVFDAWLIDRNFKNPDQSSIEVRVLLTRDQLSDLKSILQQVLDLAEEGVLTPQNFLAELKRLAATLSRDPGGLKGATAGEANLADMGYMREYIEDLPYQSEVMGLSLQDWQDWSATQQLEFVHRLEGKIRHYQTLHDHTDLWVSPSGGPVTGDSVFPILIEMLP
jgi:hypothetical protein